MFVCLDQTKQSRFLDYRRQAIKLQWPPYLT